MQRNRNVAARLHLVAKVTKKKRRKQSNYAVNEQKEKEMIK